MEEGRCQLLDMVFGGIGQERGRRLLVVLGKLSSSHLFGKGAEEEDPLGRFEVVEVDVIGQSEVSAENAPP